MPSATIPEAWARPCTGAPLETPGSQRRLRYITVALALIAALAALAVPFAPVTQDRVTMTWPPPGADPAATAAAIPLMPYQPVQLTATVPCAGAASMSTVLLSTMPLRPDPAAPPLPGLRVERLDGHLVVSSYGTQVANATQPVGSCILQIGSDPDRTWVKINGRSVGDVTGDVRPVVAGAFTEAPSTAGLHLKLITDTRFQTSMTLVKAVVVTLSALALLAALLAVARLDAHDARTRRVRRASSGRWRPRSVDLMVVAGLAAWAVIGPMTVDDGYITGIVRARGANGYIGNMYRWLNAPEAPFGWFYELYSLWAQVSAAPLWMRIPSTVLGMVCWLLLSRLVLPRLGAFATRPATVWVTAAAFAAWWLPFNLGLRPEPWIAVAGLFTLLTVERAVVTRRLLPVLLGLVVAAAATAVTPTGIVAFTPFVAGLVPLLRALRQRPDLSRFALLVLLIAAPSSALLLAYADQTLASVSEAIRVRTLIDGVQPWFQEPQRYANLLTPGSIEGSLQRRVPVLLTLLGLVGIAWTQVSGPAGLKSVGLAQGPVTRVVLTMVLSLVTLTFTPTKWTYHFGAFAGVGSAVLVIALHAWSSPALARATARPLTAGAAAAVATAALALTAGFALAGRNQWPYVSNYGITWSTLAPQLGGVSAATTVLVGGLLLAAVSGGSVAWARAGGRPVFIAGYLPAPGLLALVLVVSTVALEVGSVARAGVRQRTSYSMAADSIPTLTGSSCGLADHLRVETNPLAGLLTPSGSDDATGLAPAETTALQMAGMALPGWRAAGTGLLARGHTAWYRLGDHSRPVVVTVDGQWHPGTSLVAQFARSGGAQPTVLDSVTLADQRGAPAPRDIRIAIPDVRSADLVRLSVTAYRAPGAMPLTFSAPRTPHTVPMLDVLPAGTEAIVDWPVAFLYPCLQIAGTPDGTAALTRWRVSTPVADDSGDIVTAPGFGGPFATPRALIQAETLGVYLEGDPMRDVGTLYRWRPVTALSAPTTSRISEIRWGWQRSGHLHVPGVTDEQRTIPAGG
ncbi:MAG TPA: arabinosyltransferase domain-containing protein [Pseudonocardiaceae bacterium]|nr:arabinosyltransferase domain-containing protein [Pseudonocardiaceae bacterium]